MRPVPRQLCGDRDRIGPHCTEVVLREVAPCWDKALLGGNYPSAEVERAWRLLTSAGCEDEAGPACGAHPGAAARWAGCLRSALHLPK